MIILAKEYTDFIKRIKKTINNMGKSCSVCTLMPNTDHDADDVFGFYDRYIFIINITIIKSKQIMTLMMCLDFMIVILMMKI